MPRVARLIAITAALALGADTADAQAVPPHASWGTLPWSNGVATAAYDTVGRKLKSFREHLYQHRNASTPTRELAYDAYFGLRVGGQNLWLTSRALDDAGWDGHAGIARVVQHHGALRATQYYFSPFSAAAPIVVAVVELQNTSDAPLVDAAVFSIANLRIGGGDGTGAERISWINDAFEERGARGLALHRPMPAPTHHAASPDNPYAMVVGGGHLVDTADSGVRDDAVAGFEWDLSGLAPGQVRRVAVVLGFDDGGNRGALDAAIATVGDSPEAALAGARADWDAFFARVKAPATLTASQQRIYDRQLAVLRMGQVREPGAGHGAVVASLPPGMWNIAWVRDQSYATWAMIEAGMDTEARDALAFLFRGTGGYVCCDRDGGPWVGAPYTISITRYYGDGSEESDANERGPNIEFDGFGLALATLADYVDATDDVALVTAHDAAIFVRTADVLLGLVETTGPARGLIRADSSIWESHWYDGGRQHWAFTQATSVVGLRGAARLADRLGRAADAARYRAGADAIAAAAAALIDDRRVIRASLEQTTSYLDAAAIGFLRWGLVPADGDVARASLDAWKLGLSNPLTGHGYHRNDDGGPYDEREWIAIDLWIADAARAAGRTDEADALVAWVTDQALLNFDLVPENLDRVTADYQGEVPMVGFGAGAYVSSLWRQGSQPSEGDAGVVGDAGLDGGFGDDGDGGGCCRTSRRGGASSLLAIGLVALALRRRRRVGLRQHSATIRAT